MSEETPLASQEPPSSGSRWFTIIVIVAIILVLIGTVGYAVFIQLAGTSDVSQDISAEVEPLNSVTDEDIFEIVPSQSTARFCIDEVLRGEDYTVEGSTNQVGGQIAVNFDEPDQTSIGEIVINARNFTTGDDNRDRALRLAILRSREDPYEFIIYNPRMLDVQEMSNEDVAVKTVLDVNIRGDLTVIDAMREVVFDGEVQYNEDDTITGFLQADIRYADFDISVQAPPIVADISEEVRLVLDFVAMRPDAAQAAAEATAEADSETEIARICDDL